MWRWLPTICPYMLILLLNNTVMKKLVLSFFAILAALSVQAQEEDAHDFGGEGKRNHIRLRGKSVPFIRRSLGALVIVELKCLMSLSVCCIPRKCRPFIGVGLGGAYGKYAANQVKYNYFLGVVDPRLGLQFGRHYKVAFDANLAFERASQKEIRLCAPLPLLRRVWQNSPCIPVPFCSAARRN